MRLPSISRLLPALRQKWQNFSSVSTDYSGRWWGIIQESFAGAWQAVITIDDAKTLFGNSTLYAVTSLIAGDISKNRIKLLQYDENGFSDEVTGGSPWNPVLRRPNRYQNRIQFLNLWIVSKLTHGNTYVLKERDARGIVRALYILDPNRVSVKIAPDGSVWYGLGGDELNQTENGVVVPSSEIIHDRMCCIFHPLIGIAPIYAAGWAATVGNKIVSNSANFFANASRPGGILVVPGSISDETAARLKARWDANYTGLNAGKVAVMSDGMKYEAMRESAEQAQLIEQLKWSVEDIARPFHVPLFKLGGTVPSGASTETLQQIYYSDCLQELIESLELCLDEGLELPNYLGVQLDLMNLLRMDQASLVQTASEGVKGSVMSPDEARALLNLRPVPGGASPMAQQQNYSLAALAKRDAGSDPFKTGPAAPALPAPDTEDTDESEAEEQARAFLEQIRKGIECQQS